MRPIDRFQPLLIMMLFAAPALAAWITHATWHPTQVASYGELLDPVPPDLAGLTDARDRPASLAALHGRWVLVTVIAGTCDAVCVNNLYLARQAWLAQGRDQDRLVQASIDDGTGTPGDNPELLRYALPAAQLVALTGNVSARTYVLDPLGRTVLRFPAHPAGKGMIRDLQHLLRASKLG
jgi:cytochrome oxidase Cu insertion factor (SCO1/SenC/PrrC family)